MGQWSRFGSGMSNLKNGEHTMRKLKTRPAFKSEKQEAAFWASHDSTEFIDYTKARRMVFPRLKPSTETISLRLPKSLLEQLKTLANKRDVPYQTPLKPSCSNVSRRNSFTRPQKPHRARMPATAKRVTQPNPLSLTFQSRAIWVVFLMEHRMEDGLFRQARREPSLSGMLRKA